jgi:hypothetical protein
LSNPRLATETHFYKYGTADHLDWLKPVILNHEIFLPEFGQLHLHDPTEGKPKLTPMSRKQLVDAVYRNYLLQHPNLSIAEQIVAESEIQKLVERTDSEEIRRSLAAGIYARSSDRHRVFCMSKRWNNLAMWAKFSGNHTGYCLEFSKTGPFTTACEVEYTDVPQTMDINDLDDRGPFCFVKRTEFAGEEEVRIITLPSNNPVVNFDPSCLTRIIIGQAMSPTHEQEVREWAERRTPPLTVNKAYFDVLEQSM